MDLTAPASTKVHTTCRASGGALREIFSLGDIHLSGFRRPDDPLPPRFPLTLAVGEGSHLAQLSHTVPADMMYRQYFYRSGTNESMARHLRSLAAEVSKRAEIQPGSIVVDIGCNDGTLLKAFGCTPWRIGFDPSNIKPQPLSVDIYQNDYFTASAYPFRRKANAVTVIACFYDMEDPVTFVREVASIMADDGWLVIEQHYLPVMLANNGVDAICHEHLAYYSLRSLEFVLRQADLHVVDAETNTINGGSFRAYVRKQGEPSAAVLAMRREEARSLTFDGFAQRVKRNRDRTMGLLARLKSQGKVVAGLGASTKLNTLLSYYEITPALMPFIADRNPEKDGLVTVTGIPIVSEAEGRRRKPDYYFVGPYHFLDSLLEREAAFLQGGGRFIVPCPEPRIVP